MGSDRAAAPSRRWAALALGGLAAWELWCAWGLWFGLGGWAAVDVAWMCGRAALLLAAALRCDRAPRAAAVAPLLLLAVWGVELARDSSFTAGIRGPLLAAVTWITWRSAQAPPFAWRAPERWPGAFVVGVAWGSTFAAREPILAHAAASNPAALAVLAGLIGAAPAALWPAGRGGPAVGRSAFTVAVAACLAAASWVGWLRDWLLEGALSGVWAPLLWTGATGMAARYAAEVDVTADAADRGRASIFGAAALLACWGWGLRDASSPLNWEYAPDRALGRFPFTGGTVHPHAVDGEAPTTANILADGTRDCGSPPGDRAIAFVGDSFTFGQGLPDDQTLCRAVSEHLGASLAGWRRVNLGQPGANMAAAIATAEFAIAHHGARVVVLGLLPGDDGRAFELNSLRRLTRTFGVWVAGPLLGTQDLLEVAMLTHELWPTEAYQRAVTLAGVRAAADLGRRTGVPIVLDVNVPPGSSTTALIRDLRTLADREGLLVGPDDALAPDPADPDRPTVFPRDGHPTGWGNTLKARRLGPVIERALGQAPP